MYELTVVADPNDADYITRISPVTNEDLEILRPMFEKISNFKPYETTTDCTYSESGKYTSEHGHNFPYGDCCREDLGEKTIEELYGWTEDQVDFLMNFIPSSEYGIHTVDEVYISPISEKEVLI